MWSASIGAPRSMSRSIEAVSGEPAAVNIRRFRSRKPSRGGNPSRAAIAAHSPRSLEANSAASAATISPTVARIRHVIPAAAAMKTHFSHISCRIVSLDLPSNVARLNTAAMACTRSDRAPFRSPNSSVWTSLRWTTVPLASSVEEITHSPPNRCFGPNRPSRISRCRIPLSSGRIAVSGPTAGAKASMAPLRSYALQLSSTTSKGSRNSSASTHAGAGSVAFPNRLWIVSPVRASCAARRGRTRKVTSAPASSSRPPK